MRYILLILCLLSAFVSPSCSQKPKIIWYDVEVEVTRYLPELKGTVKIETEGRYLEPWTIYKGICDAVFQINFEKGVILPVNPAGIQLPLKIEGNKWIIDFEHTYTRNKWTIKIIGEGEITSNTISGKWKLFGGPDKEKPVLESQGEFTAHKR